MKSMEELHISPVVCSAPTQAATRTGSSSNGFLPEQVLARPACSKSAAVEGSVLIPVHLRNGAVLLCKIWHIA